MYAYYALVFPTPQGSNVDLRLMKNGISLISGIFAHSLAIIKSNRSRIPTTALSSFNLLEGYSRFDEDWSHTKQHIVIRLCERRLRSASTKTTEHGRKHFAYTVERFSEDFANELVSSLVCIISTLFDWSKDRFFNHFDGKYGESIHVSSSFEFTCIACTLSDWFNVITFRMFPDAILGSKLHEQLFFIT